MKNKNYKMIFVSVSCIVFFICAFLIISQCVSFSFFGFGVDSDGRLYVGIDHGIDVFENGEKINTIQKGTSRGYAFSIQKNDTILLASGSDVYIMDLEGEEIIEERTEKPAQTYNKLTREKNAFETVSGEKYTASRPLGMLLIRRNDQIVYRMPIFDYFIMIIFIISVPCFVSSVFILKKEKWFERF